MTTPFDLRVMGMLLEQGRRLQALSGALFLLCGAWLVLAASGVAGVTPLRAPLACSLCVGLLAGVSQTWYAMRTAFDARLLAAAADAASADAATQLIDGALRSLGLIAGNPVDRDWTSRWRGARRLLRRQALCVLAQLVALVAALVIAFAQRAQVIA